MSFSRIRSSWPVSSFHQSKSATQRHITISSRAPSQARKRREGVSVQRYVGFGYSSDLANCLITSESSTTSMCDGQSGQLWCQQTITSQRSAEWPWSRKFRLSYSNSIRTRCHLPAAICLFASQSGNHSLHGFYRISKFTGYNSKEKYYTVLIYRLMSETTKIDMVSINWTIAELGVISSMRYRHQTVFDFFYSLLMSND